MEWNGMAWRIGVCLVAEARVLSPAVHFTFQVSGKKNRRGDRTHLDRNKFSKG